MNVKPIPACTPRPCSPRRGAPWYVQVSLHKSLRRCSFVRSAHVLTVSLSP